MEATPEQAAEGLAIVRVLSNVLDRLVCTNAPISRADPGQVTKFHAMKAPGINIQQYLERIHKYASCSNECFILALIYIDRLIQRNNFLLTELNVHRVVITSILLAAKFFDDAYYNNAYYAKVGGVLVAEMNGLEVDFLFRINFSLHVTSDVFDKYRAELLCHSTTIPLPIPEPILEQYAPLLQQVNTTPVQAVAFPPEYCATTPPPAPAPMHQTGHMMVDNIHNSAIRPASQITPSPPMDAALKYAIDTDHSCLLSHLVSAIEASASLTMVKSAPPTVYYRPPLAPIPVLQRCSQSSYSAPALMHGCMPFYQPEDPMMLLEHQNRTSDYYPQLQAMTANMNFHMAHPNASGFPMGHVSVADAAAVAAYEMVMAGSRNVSVPSAAAQRFVASHGQALASAGTSLRT